MTARPKIALIGVGRIGEVHARTLARLRRLAELAMIVDPREKVAHDLADELDVERVETDAGAAFDDAGIDAVVIASSTATHAPYIEAAAASGKDIFTEKPIALDIASTDRAITAVVKAGVRMQVGFQRRFDRGYQAAWEYVQSGALGEIEMLHDAMRDPEPPPAAYLATSGGFFRDMTVHNFDCARWLMGEEQVEVFATASTMVSDEIREVGDIDTSVVTLKFASGAIATIENSRRSAFGYDVRTELFGSGGAIFVDDAQATPVRRYHREGVTEDHHHFFLNRFADAYVRELESFVSAIAHDRDVAVTGADGRAALLLAYAAEMAYRDGKPVTMADVVKRAPDWPAFLETVNQV